MSEYQFSEHEFLSVDVVTGQVILRLPSKMTSFKDPAHYAPWILEHAGRLSALRVAREAAMSSRLPIPKIFHGTAVTGWSG